MRMSSTKGKYKGLRCQASVIYKTFQKQSFIIKYTPLTGQQRLKKLGLCPVTQLATASEI